MELKEVLEELRASGLTADPSPASIVLPLFRLRELIWRGDKEIASGYGLTWADFKTLAGLRNAPPAGYKPSDLYDRLAITSGGLTKVLKKLEKDGLIQMMQNQDDARSRFVRLTDEGRALAEKVIAHFERANHEKFGAALTGQEQAELSRLLLKFLSGLDAVQKKQSSCDG